MKKILDVAYILYRRIKAVVSYGIYILYAIRYPIQLNKVVFASTEGMGGYGDNPKAIAEELHRECPELELVWLVKDERKTFPAYIRRASFSLLSRAYELSTASVWVDCHRKPYGTRKRKGQYYIQTWHGPIGFKPAGALRGKFLPKMAEIVSRADSRLIDCFVTNSAWSTDIAIRSFFYGGDIFAAGSPRCDVMFREKNRWRREIRQIYHIPQQAKLMLYAPTFRSGSQTRSRSVEAEEASLDFTKIIAALEQKTGEVWYIALRLHPQVAAHREAYPVQGQAGDRLVDVSQYDDMYELLAAADAMLSDYSTVAFDASYIEMPVFLYADDLEEYQRDRGALLWDMHSLPFPFAETEQELLKNIREFNRDKYLQELHQLFDEVRLNEDGHASERVVRRIRERGGKA